MKRSKTGMCLGVVMTSCLLAAAVSLADGLIPERRRDQFQNQPGYIVLPYYFDLPGMGSGYGVLGALSNVEGTYADVAGTFFLGDVDGEAFGVESVHLVPRTLILDLGGAHISRVVVQSYYERGMAAKEDDYTEVELGNALYGGGRLTATFLDRRLEAFLGYYGGRLSVEALRDQDGNVIVEADGDSSDSWYTTVFGGRVDLTDDYMDPRRGIRLELSGWWSPQESHGPNYLVADTSLSAFVPLGPRSTWVFNYLWSDAHVLSRGETDPNRVADDAGFSYDESADPRERAYIDSVVAQNTHGAATSLGGFSRLRSYPEGRFSGAHSQFAGTEIRWNVTDQFQPFDFFFVRDVRTAVQIAPFFEIGTVDDRSGDLWSDTRSSYGVGFRVVTASGLVYRLDLAGGSEGFQPCIFFQYPWEL